MKVGFIGLGTMGCGMAVNLQKAGLLNFIWNRTPERSQQFSTEHSVTVSKTVTELASQSDVIITSVSAE